MDGLILLTILLLQEAAQPAAGNGLQVEATVALGGNVSGGGFTELIVRAYSVTGGALTLETADGAPVVMLDAPLPPGESTEFRMPLGINASGPPATLHATLDGRNAQRLDLNTVFHVRPPAVLAGGVATRLLSRLPGTRAIKADSLPHYAPAYRQLTALAVDGMTLAALDDMQLRALLEYVGTCGRLLLIDVSRSVLQVFNNRAACNGRFLGSVSGGTDAAAAFVRILDEPAAGSPTAEQLGRLLAATHEPAVDLAALGYFWCAYLLVFGLLASRARTRITALGFSAVGALLVLTIWPAATSRAYVAWAEAGIHDRVARYSALERYSAPRRATHRLPVAGFGAVATNVLGDDFSLQWGKNVAQSSLVWQAAPFGNIDKLTSGSFTVESNLRTQLTNDGVAVCNTGSGMSRPAYLNVGAATYAVPPLAPGTTWMSASDTAMASLPDELPELRLFMRRSARHNSALLQALPIAGRAAEDRAWLMRYASGRDGVAACAR